MFAVTMNVYAILIVTLSLCVLYEATDENNAPFISDLKLSAELEPEKSAISIDEGKRRQKKHIGPRDYDIYIPPARPFVYAPPPPPPPPPAYDPGYWPSGGSGDGPIYVPINGPVRRPGYRRYYVSVYEPDYRPDYRPVYGSDYPTVYDPYFGPPPGPGHKPSQEPSRGPDYRPDSRPGSPDLRPVYGSQNNFNITEEGSGDPQFEYRSGFI